MTIEEIDAFYEEQQKVLELMLEIEKKVEEGDVSIPIPEGVLVDEQS